MTKDELEEKVAEAIYDEDDPWHKAWPWPSLHPTQGSVEQYRSIARAALAIAMPAAFEMAAEVADTMRTKHSSPVRDGYSCGAWDQGIRIASKVRELGEKWK